MPFFGLVWVTSWVSCFFSNQALSSIPDYLSITLPAKVFSAVNNPLDSDKPLFVYAVGTGKPYSYLSGLHSQKFSAFLPSWDFQLGGNQSQSSSNKAKTPEQSRRKLETVDNVLCRPGSAPTKEVPVAPTMLSQSASWVEVPASRASKPSFPDRIMQVMQNLLKLPAWAESRDTTPSPVAVVRIREQGASGDRLINEKIGKRQGLWMSLAGRKSKSVATSSGEPEQFQVWVKGHLVAQIPEKPQAERFAKRIAQLLQNSNVDASQLKPTLVDGKPGGKLGNNQLFVIDDAIATNFNRDRQLLAIEWVNNLRLALGETPLTLVEAQAQMHGLTQTDTKLEGLASWYGGYFHGRQTANGEIYNQDALTAAHPSLPFNTFLKVTNLKNGDAVIVRVTDRGPYIAPRTLDLSRGAARCVKSEEVGVIPYEAVVMKPL
ncbi:septal ring lytic transglycosylase RlpA family protein [Coleofasciculus sp. FACHB-125]|uniref:septal ring lytic transglycosylase RlpA family protein n=1 Tax=Coleofasciculus sp. FACHB-125 TaxID=2692784 RepID=UPI001F559693|nr:septal ring lytic transglycosylase RlpA family protein [Coleofasciculus sp. FACHB-125]